MKKFYAFFAIICFSITSLAYAKPSRIITLSGAISETVDALGYGDKIVATDVTTMYPAYLAKVAKVSKNRSVSLEGLVSFKPDLIIAPDAMLSKEIQAQLTSLKIKYIILKQEYSIDGAIDFITKIGEALEAKAKAKILTTQLKSDLNKTLAKVKANTKKTPKVIFIYARGTGTMSVAGKGSSLDAIIKLAGGKNAIQDFTEFKPYTTESLVKANPDIILMFDFGISSLGGKEAVLKMPGMNLTNAGKNKKIIDMDGNLLINFSVRLDEAIAKLNDKFNQ